MKTALKAKKKSRPAIVDAPTQISARRVSRKIVKKAFKKCYRTLAGLGAYPSIWARWEEMTKPGFDACEHTLGLKRSELTEGMFTQLARDRRIDVTKYLQCRDDRLSRDPRFKTLSALAKHKLRIEVKLPMSEEDAETERITNTVVELYRELFPQVSREAYDREEYEQRFTVAKEYLTRLEAEATDGYLNAVREVVWLAHQATCFLATLADKDPEYVALVAGKYTHWPVITQVSRDKKAPYKPLLDRIRLGASKPKGKRQAVTMGGETTPRNWAAHLIDTLQHYADLWRRGTSIEAFTEARDRGWNLGTSDEYFPFPEGVTLNRGTGINKTLSIPFYSYDLDTFKQAKRLASLSAKTSKTWWLLAKSLFIKLTSNRPWAGEYGLSTYAYGRTHGTKRSDVLKVVEQAFFSVAKSL